MARSGKSTNYIEKIETEMKSNQSTLSLVLGALIVIVVAVLIFNYFNRQKTPEVGPAQESEQEGDVSPENLPGKYTVKEGDTLFTIAEKYYQDGFKYPEIVKENSLTNEDTIEVGQILEIPKLEDIVEVSPTETQEATITPLSTDTPPPTEEKGVPLTVPQDTNWGPSIKGETYTVVEGDWLSTIAARAYGDIMAYPKLAEANNISNPDLITPGMVLKLPR